MTTSASKSKPLARKARQVIAKPWVHGLVRLGYVVRGLLYITIGILALQFALGTGGKTTDQMGAIAMLGRLPLGQSLLMVMAVGLVSYSLWGFTRAIFDPLAVGTEPKGLLKRAGYAFSGLSYGALAIPVILYLLKQPRGLSSGTDSSVSLLKSSSGPWLVAGLGLFWIVMAVGQFYAAYKTDMTKELNFREMSAKETEVAIWTGRIGYAARGIVFGLTGLLAFQIIPTADVQEVQGFDQSLGTLAQAPYGSVLLALIAFGLILFGLFSILMARWHNPGPSRSK